MRKRLFFTCNIYFATLYQLFVAFLVLWLSRFAFAAYNSGETAVGSFGELLGLGFSGLRFDLSALLYFNVLFIAMRLLPLHVMQKPGWVKASMWVYGICNALMLALNIADIPYYSFTGTRLRWSNIINMGAEGGTAGLVFAYAADYWWAVLLGAAAIALTIWLALRARVKPTNIPIYGRGALFVLLGGLTFLGMRGRVGSGIPLAIADAAYGVEKAPQINVVLNTPFCILRSLNTKKSNTLSAVEYMSSAEMSALRSSLHVPADSSGLMRRNIVTIIIESGGAEWLDSLCVVRSKGEDSLMPFLDSIAGVSTVFRNTIATGRMSIGGETAVVAGFPAFDPFYYMLSPYNKNTVDAPARLLAEKGWDTAFFYGVNPGSFNMDQTAYAMGYKKLHDRYSYGNDADYDGKWGIFDDAMARYTVAELSEMQQPFMALWFTISAHGPFTLPDGYDTSGFRHRDASAERGLEYTDASLREFFALASREPWFENTTFIITGDHGNRDFKGSRYDLDPVRNRIPFIIYTPDGSMPPRMIGDRVVAQFDIAATTLALVGYDESFVAIGRNAFGNPDALFGINRSDGGRYMVVNSEYLLYTDPDCRRIEEVYAADDYLLEHRLDTTQAPGAHKLLRRAQAMLQDYAARMTGDKLSARRH